MGLRCGSTSTTVTESVNLHPPDKGPVGERLLTVDVMTRVLRAMISAWEPEHGIVTNTGLHEAIFHKGPFEARVGWINYYSRLRGPIPPLPAPVTIQPVEDKGTLVILFPEPITTSPEHLALAQRVSAELMKAGVLRPIGSGASR